MACCATGYNASAHRMSAAVTSQVRSRCCGVFRATRMSERTTPEAPGARRAQVASSKRCIALEDLPEEQRDVFVAHEKEGRRFKELIEATSASLNTLLSRNH